MGFNTNTIFLHLALILYGTSMAGYLIYLFQQKEMVQKAAVALLGLGVVSHLVHTVGLGMDMGTLPVRNLSQSLSVSALAFGGMFLFFQFRFRLKILGVFASVLLTLALIAAVSTHQDPTLPSEVFKGFWFHAHILLVFLGEAALGLACGAGILYLLQERGIKAKSPGFFFKRLPSLDLLDNAGSGFLNTGFVLLTAGLITGFIYAKLIWGRFWSWDLKELFSVATWLVYAAILHFRFHSGWRGQKSAIMTIVGFLIIIFTFLGVNLFLGGHHQEFTR